MTIQLSKPFGGKVGFGTSPDERKRVGVRADLKTYFLGTTVGCAKILGDRCANESPDARCTNLSSW